jgi:DNA-binding transcriptional ArsR family regulator
MARPAAHEDVFRAIADPTRRAMLDLLSQRGEQPAGALGKPFHITPPAVSRHLRVLKVAGLVAERKDGRQRLYSLRPGPLREVVDWARHYERFWQGKLAALGAVLDARAQAQKEKK